MAAYTSAAQTPAVSTANLAAGSRAGSLAALSLAYAFTLLVGIMIGGMVYELRVIMPLWLGRLPDSVVNWNINTQYPIMPGNFWEAVVPSYALVSLALFIAAWFTRKPQKTWFLVAAACGIVGPFVDLFFLVPLLKKTVLNNGAGLSGAEITRLALLWKSWIWLPVAAAICGWFSGVRGLSLTNSNHSN